jgi:hypothetical protein
MLIQRHATNPGDERRQRSGGRALTRMLRTSRWTAPPPSLAVGFLREIMINLCRAAAAARSPYNRSLSVARLHEARKPRRSLSAARAGISPSCCFICKDGCLPLSCLSTIQVERFRPIESLDFVQFCVGDQHLMLAVILARVHGARV